jgi:hypothetical protein
MKKWLFLLLGAIMVAGAAFGLRQAGVDVAGLADQVRGIVPAASVPGQQQAQGNSPPRQ